MVEDSDNAFETENDDMTTGGTNTNFVDGGEDFPNTSNPNFNTCTWRGLNQ